MSVLEIWKPIKDYEEFYEVSNLGRVRSLSYRSWNAVIKRIKILNLSTDHYGYKVVTLRKNNKSKYAKVHRLVGEAFIEKLEGKQFINHIDYNRSNNIVSNLEWCTPKENTLHSIHKFKKPQTNSKLPISGEKYIHIYRNKKYRVRIETKDIDKSFNSIKEAIKYRNEVLKNG